MQNNNGPKIVFIFFMHNIVSSLFNVGMKHVIDRFCEIHPKTCKL